MIVKILAAGKSFKGLGTYLTHDAGANTDERVAWTHTLNLANDHVPSAIDEMLWTSRNAELLKQEAGIRAGGRSTENAVKHLSLNWAPDEEPSREHMIATSEDYLRHMKWDEHQAVLVAHQDREHSHVHVMLNCVHPETGLKLDENFEYRRSQAWALDYERENGRIYCEQRLKDEAERQDAPTRPAWMAFKGIQKTYEDDEKARRELAANSNDREYSPDQVGKDWDTLKDLQRRERDAFHRQSRLEFSEMRLSTYRENREEFRPEWREYFAELKSRGESEELQQKKADILEAQQEALWDRRDSAWEKLRLSQREGYRELLDGQIEARQGLHERLDGREPTAPFLAAIEGRVAVTEFDLAKAFDAAGREASLPANGNEWTAVEKSVAFDSDPDDVRGASNVGAGLAIGFAFGLTSLAESLVDGFVGAKPDLRPKRPEPENRKPTLFEEAAQQTARETIRKREEDESEWRKRQNDNYWD